MYPAGASTGHEGSFLSVMSPHLLKTSRARTWLGPFSEFTLKATVEYGTRVTGSDNGIPASKHGGQ